MYYCNAARGMALGLVEKHLKIGKSICDGYERCVLQASKLIKELLRYSIKQIGATFEFLL